MIERPFARPLLGFRLFEVEVSVELTFVMTTFLLGGARSASVPSFAEWLAVVFVAVLAHELGHALVARRFGLTPAIRLYGWGGLTSFGAGPALGPWRRAAISAAGPAVNIAMGAAAYLARDHVPADAPGARVALDDMVFAAGAWGFVNLAPLLPLDGGHVSEALFARFAPKLERRGSQTISVVTGIALAALAWSRGAVVHAFAAGWLAIESGRALREERARAHDAALRADLGPKLLAALDARDGEALVALATSAPRPATDAIATWLAEYVALGHAFRGEFAEAAKALVSRRGAHRASVPVETCVVMLAVEHRKRSLAARAGEADPDAWALAVPPSAALESWETACERLRGEVKAPIDAAAFARLREAAEILGVDGEAARIGEALFDMAPDPDLAAVLSRLWRRADDEERARSWAKTAEELGFRGDASPT